jgi:hypothetical protein
MQRKYDIAERVCMMAEYIGIAPKLKYQGAQKQTRIQGKYSIVCMMLEETGKYMKTDGSREGMVFDGG